MAWGLVCIKYSVLSWEKIVDGSIRNTHKIISDNLRNLILIAGGVKFQITHDTDICIQEIIGIEFKVFGNLNAGSS